MYLREDDGPYRRKNSFYKRFYSVERREMY
jgi:hypothetical protein